MGLPDAPPIMTDRCAIPTIYDRRAYAALRAK